MTPLRVVVVGHGMVGSRFVDELLARAPGATVAVTVLGAEEYEPYNRVLLSDVVAGRTDVASLTLPARPSGAVVRPGVTAVALDRAGRRVLADDGATYPYDVVVLATGARANVPRMAGLRTGQAAGLPAGVHALRTLDDAREIVAAAANARRAVVLGGGVLGLEAACGLAGRGLAVTVLHGGPHVMDRQLDGDAAAATGVALARLGVDVRTDAAATGVAHDGRRLRGVRLGSTGTGGELIPADLLVLTAGTVPETALASSAGLAVRRGVVVGDDLATADPAVFAIGDCAEPPEGGTGLVAQGWEQARRLAAALGGSAAVGPPDPAAGQRGDVADAEGDRAPSHPAGPPAGGPNDVVKLKAQGVDVSAMGPRDVPAGARVVRLSDPAAGRHVEVVVHAGRVVGATCVGDPGVAADLVAAYTRATPVPRDPAHLLLRPVRRADTAAEPSPTLMPDRATVCRCNGVTKGDVVAQWRAGARSTAEVVAATRATTGCGGCADAVCGLVEWLARADPPAADAHPTGATPAGRDPVVADAVVTPAVAPAVT